MMNARTRGAVLGKGPAQHRMRGSVSYMAILTSQRRSDVHGEVEKAALT